MYYLSICPGAEENHENPLWIPGLRADTWNPKLSNMEKEC